MENHSYKEQSVLKKITEQTQKSQSMTLDEAICSEFNSNDFCGCRTLGEKWNVIMSLYPKVKAGNPYGHSALRQAISNGCLELTKYLVKNGASTTDMDGSRRTAAMRAIQYNHPDIAIYLIEQGLGFDWYKERWSTDTVMLQAVDKGYYEVVKCLVEHSASVNVSNKDGDTPLMRAIRRGYFDIAEYLVKQGAHVSADWKWQGRTVQDCVEEGLRSTKFRIERMLGI